MLFLHHPCLQRVVISILYVHRRRPTLSGGVVADYTDRLEGAFVAPPNFQNMLAFLERGFRVLARLAVDRRIEFIRSALDAFADSGQSDEPDKVAEKFDIPLSDARDAVFAASMMIATITNGPEPAQEFLAAGRAARAFDDSVSEALHPLAELVEAERDKVKDGLKRANLAGQVLPSLTLFDVAVDLRLKFDDGKVVGAVPVLVAYLDTDAEGQRVWVQLTQVDAERLIEQLQRGLTSLKAAQRMGSGLLGSS